MTRLLPVLALLAFDGECGVLSPDPNATYTDESEACGLETSPEVVPLCAHGLNHGKQDECLKAIDALTCEQLSALVIPEACSKVCQR